jgi:hypothetical protein
MGVVRVLHIHVLANWSLTHSEVKQPPIVGFAIHKEIHDVGIAKTIRLTLKPCPYVTPPSHAFNPTQPFQLRECTLDTASD